MFRRMPLTRERADFSSDSRRAPALERTTSQAPA